MRRVEFKVWIPHQYDAPEGTPCHQKRLIEGTGKFSEDYSGKGLFHIWGSSYEEFESGAGNYTIAIVEKSDGTVEQVLPQHIRFLDAP